MDDEGTINFNLTYEHDY